MNRGTENQPRTEAEKLDDIRQGEKAMRQIVNGSIRRIEQGVYRKDLGWVELRRGWAGEAPEKDRARFLKWWMSMKTVEERRRALFRGGSGIAHIVAKRDWEGKNIEELRGQTGKDVALKLVEVLVRGRIRKGNPLLNKIEVYYDGYYVYLAKDSRNLWLLTGYAKVATGYTLIMTEAEKRKFVMESVDVIADVELCCPTHSEPTRGRRTEWVLYYGDEQTAPGILFDPTHVKPTEYRQDMGAADSVEKNVADADRWRNPEFGTAEYGWGMFEDRETRFCRGGSYSV